MTSASDTTSISPLLTQEHVFFPPKQKVGDQDFTLEYESGSPAWQCSFSQDGMCIAVAYGAPDCCVRVFRWINKEWILDATLEGIHERTVRSVAFAPIQQPLVLASASFDGSLAIWEYAGTEWECTAQLEGHESEVKCVTWNATGSLLASCGRDKTVWLWECYLPGSVGGSNDGGDFECIAVLNGHEGDVKCIRFADSHGQWGDGEEILLSASYDDSIKVWAEDAGDWYCAASITGVHTSTIWSMTVSPSSVRMISGSDDNALAIYKCYTAAEKKRLFPEEPQDQNGLWKCVGKLENAHEAAVYSVDYAPSKAGHGRLVSAGADSRIQIFREALGSTSDLPLFSLETSVLSTQGDINCVCWSPDGSRIASVGDDGSLRLWRFDL